jgi:hypothetical protein
MNDGNKKAPKELKSLRSLHIRFFWKIHFITNLPEVQGYADSLKEMVSYDSQKIAQNWKGVKRDFRFPFDPYFQPQDRKRNHNLLGVAPTSQKLLLRANSFNSLSFKLGPDM